MTQTLAEYLINKEIRQNTTYHYNGVTGHKGYLVEPGILVSDEHLNKLYPLGSKVTLWNFNEKGDNPDRKRVI